MTIEVKEEKVPYLFMLPLVLGTMMNPLNSTMLATALVSLCNSYKMTVGSGAILITCLYVTSTIAQPLMGRLADIFSAKKINTLGFILVLIAALIGVFAPAFSWLIVSRVILGLGTSAAYPSAMALINKKYALEHKQVPGSVLGIVAMSAQLSMVMGPVLGGILTQWLGWKGVFFINIPWVLTAIYLSRYIPDYPASTGTNPESLSKRLDLPGILLFSAFLLTLLFLLIQHTYPWQQILPVVALLLLLIFWERKQEKPFIDVRLFANNPFLCFIYIRTFAVSYILYDVLYGLPQWIESVKHIQPGQTGLMMVPNSVMSIFFGFWASKNNNVFMQNIIGVLIMLFACGGLFFIDQNAGLFFIISVSMVMGIAEGITLVANQALLNNEAPAAQKGVSFGLARTFGYLGAIASGSQLKVLFHAGITDPKFHLLSITTIYSCLIVVLLLISLWLRRNESGSQEYRRKD